MATQLAPFDNQHKSWSSSCSWLWHTDFRDKKLCGKWLKSFYNWLLRKVS